MVLGILLLVTAFFQALAVLALVISPKGTPGLRFISFVCGCFFLTVEVLAAIALM